MSVYVFLIKESEISMVSNHIKQAITLSFNEVLSRNNSNNIGWKPSITAELSHWELCVANRSAKKTAKYDKTLYKSLI